MPQHCSWMNPWHFFPLSSFHKAWSITYHSWLTFVLLIWSCTLWMIRDRRKYAMLSSPFMVFYGNLLLILQYIWSIELKNDELPQVSGFLERKEPGELASKVSVTNHWDFFMKTQNEYVVTKNVNHFTFKNPQYLI